VRKRAVSRIYYPLRVYLFHRNDIYSTKETTPTVYKAHPIITISTSHSSSSSQVPERPLLALELLALLLLQKLLLELALGPVLELALEQVLEPEPVLELGPALGLKLESPRVLELVVEQLLPCPGPASS
jgi:hypothetical protein